METIVKILGIIMFPIFPFAYPVIALVLLLLGLA